MYKRFISIRRQFYLREGIAEIVEHQGKTREFQLDPMDLACDFMLVLPFIVGQWFVPIVASIRLGAVRVPHGSVVS